MNKIGQTYLLLFIVALLPLQNNYAEGKPIIGVENLRVILPPPVARSTAAYGSIKNTGDISDTLINISSNAGEVMLHQTSISNGQAQMNPIEEFEIKAGEALVLKPMSYHLMLVGIDHDVIKKNGKVILTLVFKKSGLIQFEMPVLPQ